MLLLKHRNKRENYFKKHKLIFAEFSILDCSYQETMSTTDLITTLPSITSTEPSDLDDIESFTLEHDLFDESVGNDFDTATEEAKQSKLRRKKRHIGYTASNSIDNNAYTMEVMVAVDRKMQEYHGKNINAYVLTLMSIVSNIYADASIGNSINVAVVHILLLNLDDLHVESNHIGMHFMILV